ncbi:MAG: nucleotidyltransferase domain-containing protein [Oscillospiraceae bacterium]|nr:nucleotidyltransferase domain-containing protein [Oscillospiraceae bacterium]
MSKIITREEAIKIAQQFALRIKSEIDKNAEVYLFGSTARNEAHINSDIDIAVVSTVFGDDFAGDFTKLNLLAFNINSDIEAHAIIYEDWIETTPFTAEIKKDGVLIWA